MPDLPAMLFVAAAVGLVWAFYVYRRDLRRARVRVVVDPARSSTAGGFGPEWDHLIAAIAARNNTQETHDGP